MASIAKMGMGALKGAATGAATGAKSAVGVAKPIAGASGATTAAAAPAAATPADTAPAGATPVVAAPAAPKSFKDKLGALAQTARPGSVAGLAGAMLGPEGGATPMLPRASQQAPPTLLQPLPTMPVTPQTFYSNAPWY